MQLRGSPCSLRQPTHSKHATPVSRCARLPLPPLASSSQSLGSNEPAAPGLEQQLAAAWSSADGRLAMQAPPKATTRRPAPTYAKPSITSTGTLMPSAEWYPAWMRYRSREDNHVFWTDKFNRNSLEILPAEKRWTVFSTFWYLVMQFRFYAVPPAFRFFIAMGWRRLMFAAYGAHKALVLWQCKVDAALAAKAAERRASAASSSSQPSSFASSSGSSESSSLGGESDPSGSGREDESSGSSSSSSTSGGSSSSSSSEHSQGGGPLRAQPTFSKTMALRRLHWQNSLLGEIMYLVNVYKTGRIHLLPPTKKPAERPTFFWLF